VLQGHVDVTLRRPREAEDYRETLQLARRKISHLIAMVQGLLTLARIDRADQPDPEATVDLAQLVRSEAPTFRAAVAERDVAFVVNAPESVSVAGAPEMLREVVTNLLDNAVKYTRQGRIEVTVRLHDHETAALVVSDTGVGMTEDEQAQATDRFFRAASMHATQVDGSGLGLSLVDQIVRWHGGTLHIESAPKQGTTVTVQLLRSSKAP
jgi:signal transduction histidine kinase